jgi:hypothetical protein
MACSPDPCPADIIRSDCQAVLFHHMLPRPCSPSVMQLDELAQATLLAQ